GYVLNVNAPGQTAGAQAYEFDSWSDGGAAAHQITTGANATTYTAAFATATGGGGPSADARVLEASPGSNYGASTALVVEGGSDPDVWSYLRFETGDLDGSVTRATVRLYCYSGTNDGPAIYQSLNTTWSESGLTWTNRPARRPGAIDDRGAIPTGAWVEFDVTPRVVAEGTYTFVLVSFSTDAASFRSKEFGGGFAPRLVIETSGADTQAPTAPGGLSGVVPANQSLRVDLRWTAATDNIGVTGYEIFRDGNLLQTVGAVTSFSDAAVDAGETYEYRVRALDAANNRSANSNAATVVVPSEPPSGTTVNPDRDARVQEANPTTNYGASPVLKAEGGSDPDVESYLRFTVANPGGAVQNARLRLFVTDGSADAPALFTTSTAWTESGITWSTRPARSASPVADAGAIAAGSWVEYDVTSVVRGGGTYGFVLASGSADGANFSSRQGSNPPQLLLTVGSSLAAAAEPDPAPETAGTPVASPVASEPATETPDTEAPAPDAAPTEPAEPAPTDPAQPADLAPTGPAVPTVWQPFADGFETGDLTAWDESAGLGVGADATRGSLVAVASRTGAEGGTDATGAFARTDLAPAQTDLYTRLVVNRYDGGTQAVAILSLLTESGATAFTLAFGPDGELLLVDARGNVVTSWVKLDEPSWHELQLHLQTGAGLVELWVDGLLVHQAGANLGGLPLGGLILGDAAFQPGRAYTLAFDDIAVDI
nr:DNRLRE domain-containing protein [Propionibacteriaceae bacterium]